MKGIKLTLCIAAGLLFGSFQLIAQENNSHQFNTLEKNSDDALLFMRMQDIAYVDKVRICGPSPAYQPRSECQFKDSLRSNQLKFYSYIFFPKDLKQNKKYPVVIFSHGGIHASVGSNYAHIFRELVAQGYIVVAPEYRGSTGYGKELYEAIDYGGLENEDVLAARDYMVESYKVVDPERIGLLGWSHGGMISLMNILNYPDKYACAYAGVPVSDVTYRLTYQEKDYLKNFTQKYHVNATPQEKPEEYARRSPVTYASKLCKPLKIVTCVNDDDVSWTEVQRMADALKANNKDFEYEVYPKMAGAHSFERMDIVESTDIRFKTYQFLARYLKPKHPFKNTDQLRKAGYFYY